MSRADDDAMVKALAQRLLNDIDGEIERDLAMVLRLLDGDCVVVYATGRVVIVLDRIKGTATRNHRYEVQDLLTGKGSEHLDEELSNPLSEMEVIARAAT